MNFTKKTIVKVVRYHFRDLEVLPDIIAECVHKVFVRIVPPNEDYPKLIQSCITVATSAISTSRTTNTKIKQT